METTEGWSTSASASDFIFNPEVNGTAAMLASNNNNTTIAHVFERHTWPEFLHMYSPLALMVDRAITPLWYIIGVSGNVMSAKIWLEKRMRQNNSSAVYLATLSITDMIFLLLHILQELKYAWGVRTLSYPGVCEGYFLFYLMAQYLSPTLVLCFTVERYIAVCHPFQKEKYCTTRRAVRVVLGMVVLCLLLCCIQSYFWTYLSSTRECTVRNSAYKGGDASLWSVWSWVSELLVFFLVPIVILVFNILVIKEVRSLSTRGQTVLAGQTKPNHNASAATTVMLLSVSFYVIFTTIPATLVYVLVFEFPEGNPYLTDAQIHTDPEWQRYLVYITGRKVVEEICLSHYACNFFLYLITGVHFRQSLMETFNCKFVRCNRDKYTEISQRTTWHNTLTTKV